MVACNIVFLGWGFVFEFALLGGPVALKTISLNCGSIVKCWLTREVSRGSCEDERCGQTSGARRRRRSLWAFESGRRQGCCPDPEHGRQMEPPRSCTPGVNGKIRPWQRISKAMTFFLLPHRQGVGVLLLWPATMTVHFRCGGGGATPSRSWMH